MATAEQADDQAGNDRVLPDDSLADLGAHRLQRGPQGGGILPRAWDGSARDGGARARDGGARARDGGVRAWDGGVRAWDARAWDARAWDARAWGDEPGRGLMFGGQWVCTSPRVSASRVSISRASVTSATSSRGTGPNKVALIEAAWRPVLAATAAQTGSAPAPRGRASLIVIRFRAASRRTAAARSRDRRDRYRRPWPSTVSEARTITGRGSVTSGPSLRIRHRAASTTAMASWIVTR